jgi:hypothetical protein
MQNSDDGRVMCEVDDLVRLFKSGQETALQHVAEVLIGWMNEAVGSAKPKWSKGNIGDGVELGEYIVLTSLCQVMIQYLRNDRTGRDNKRHHEECLVGSVTERS